MRALVLAPVLVGAVLLPASWRHDTVRCSATGLTAPLLGQHVPGPVATMRKRIFKAAQRCDYAELKRLGDLHGKGLEFSFGSDADTARYWRDREHAGEPVMRYLVKLLNLPLARSQGFYAWPSAFRLHPTDADWRAVRALYPQRVIDAMRRSGIGYSGYRVGIKPNGDWQLFVTGD